MGGVSSTCEGSSLTGVESIYPTPMRGMNIIQNNTLKNFFGYLINQPANTTFQKFQYTCFVSLNGGFLWDIKIFLKSSKPLGIAGEIFFRNLFLSRVYTFVGYSKSLFCNRGSYSDNAGFTPGAKVGEYCVYGEGTYTPPR